MTNKRALIVDEPQAGFYRCKLVKGGPWVGISIFWAAPLDPWDGSELDRSPILRCVVNGQMADPYVIWTHCADEPISEMEFHELRRRAVAPDSQPSNEPINLNNVKPLGF